MSYLERLKARNLVNGPGAAPTKPTETPSVASVGALVGPSTEKSPLWSRDQSPWYPKALHESAEVAAISILGSSITMTPGGASSGAVRWGTRSSFGGEGSAGSITANSMRGRRRARRHR